MKKFFLFLPILFLSFFAICQAPGQSTPLSPASETTTKTDSLPAAPTEVHNIGDVIYTECQYLYLEGDTAIVSGCGFIKSFYGLETGLPFVTDANKKDLNVLLLQATAGKCESEDVRITTKNAIKKGIITVNETSQNGFGIGDYFGYQVNLKKETSYWVIGPGSVPTRTPRIINIPESRIIQFKPYKW